MTGSESYLRSEQEKSRGARRNSKTENRKLLKHPLRQWRMTSLSSHKSSYLSPLSPPRKSSPLTAPTSTHVWTSSSKSRSTPSVWNTTSRSPARTSSRLSPTCRPCETPRASLEPHSQSRPCRRVWPNSRPPASTSSCRPSPASWRPSRDAANSSSARRPAFTAN